MSGTNRLLVLQSVDLTACLVSSCGVPKVWASTARDAFGQHGPGVKCCQLATVVVWKHDERICVRSPSNHQRLRAIEFFAGVGGFATAAERVWPDVQLEITPIDIDQDAKLIYELNHPHCVLTREIQSLSTETLQAMSADLWWLSPPCQPYSRRGHQRGMSDPRSASLLHLINQVDRLCPQAIAFENVAGFADSQAHQLLLSALQRTGYYVRQRMLCPSEMNWPIDVRDFILSQASSHCAIGTPCPLIRVLSLS